MSGRESAEARGRRYLVEGRLVVEHVGEGVVLASCRGSGATHRLGWTAGRGWYCGCPARSTCSHLHALQLVVAIDGSGA